MGEFLQAVAEYRFLQYALVAGLLASLCSGVIGTYVVTRRISYISGGIAHAVLGGMGAAYFLKVSCNLEFLHPLYGAVIAALAAAIIIGLVSLKASQREDTAISALWATGMAIGIILISQTPGYNADLMSYLFGNILMVTPRELWLLAFLNALVVGICLIYHRQFAAVCFDEEFARVRGLKVEFFYLLLLCLIALTVVVLVTVVGIVMVVALLTLPAAIAGYFTFRLVRTMYLATALSAMFIVGGLWLSYAPDLPPGATIILLAGTGYLTVSLLVGRRHKRTHG